MSPLLDYFGRLAVIHLPQRTDRYRALARELEAVGISSTDPRVVFPDPPMPADKGGFGSKGVYGNFLSHLDILESAQRDGLEAAWVLEDDAIFSRRFRQTQSRIAEHLRSHPWDLCFLGHSVGSGLPSSPSGLVRFAGPFIWSHCYAVHARALPEVIAFLRRTLTNPPGHPEGAQVYIDAAFTLLRQRAPHLISLAASPVLSVQKGSPSSLAGAPWYDKNPLTRPVSTLARAARDQLWRYGVGSIGPAGHHAFSHPDLTTFPAEPWPPTRK